MRQTGDMGLATHLSKDPLDWATVEFVIARGVIGLTGILRAHLPVVV